MFRNVLISPGAVLWVSLVAAASLARRFLNSAMCAEAGFLARGFGIGGLASFLEVVARGAAAQVVELVCVSSGWVGGSSGKFHALIRGAGAGIYFFAGFHRAFA